MVQFNLNEMGIAAKQATFCMATASSMQKNEALLTLADHLSQSTSLILEANEYDRQQAKVIGLSESMIDRLSLEGRIQELITDIKSITKLTDLIGEEFENKTLENGLQVCKRRTPIGVLGVIYESRPNVTIDVATLAIKTGNCAILRGGSEALYTNQILLKSIQHALKKRICLKMQFK